MANVEIEGKVKSIDWDETRTRLVIQEATGVFGPNAYLAIMFDRESGKDFLRKLKLPGSVPGTPGSKNNMSAVIERDTFGRHVKIIFGAK